MRFSNYLLLSAIALSAVTGLSSAAIAGPIWVYSTSTGVQPSNVGVITLTQQGAAVEVNVDLLPNYGFINTGGPHTPFAFNLAGTGTLGITFNTPAGGTYPKGTFSLNTSGGDNTATFGTFGYAIDDTAGNGSPNGYFGDLDFTLTRVGGLSTDDFIANENGWFFSADISNGTNTGAQGWKDGIDPPGPGTSVPEPLTLSLFGAGLTGLIAARRRKKAQRA